MKCHTTYATQNIEIKEVYYNKPKSHCCKLRVYDFGRVNCFTATCFMDRENWMQY